MSVRDEVIDLIDEMSVEKLRAVEQYVRYINSGARGDFFNWILDNAPYDDEPTSPEEEAAVEEARAETRRGETISAEEARRMLVG